MANITDEERGIAPSMRGKPDPVTPAKKLQPSNVKELLSSPSLPKKIRDKGIKFAAGYIVKKLLNQIQVYLGVAWTPISLFLSIAKSAKGASAKLQEMESRIEELENSLNQFIQLSSDLIRECEKLLVQTNVSFAGIADPDWHQANNLLTQCYESLVELRELGYRANPELETIPSLSKMFRDQGIPASVSIANTIDITLRLGTINKFKAAVNSVDGMVKKLES